MTYSKLRDLGKEHDPSVVDFEAKLKNHDLKDLDLQLIMAEIIKKAQENSNREFRGTNVAADLLSYCYTNTLTAAERSAFQTSTGLS